MILKGKNDSDSNVIGTLIGEESEFKGTLISERSIRIEGGFEGEIRCQGDVHIGHKSRVSAQIWGNTVVVAGAVVGNIFATHGIEIQKTGRITGDMAADRLWVEEGAIYKGTVEISVAGYPKDGDG